MDNRLKQRLEDWDNNSSKVRAMGPSPPGDKRGGRQSAFTYTYSPEVSMYDKDIQTRKTPAIREHPDEQLDTDQNDELIKK